MEGRPRDRVVKSQYFYQPDTVNVVTIKTQNKIVYNLLRVHYNQLYNQLVILVYCCVCVYTVLCRRFSFIDTTIVHRAYGGQYVVSETNHLLRLVTTHTMVRIHQNV